MELWVQDLTSGVGVTGGQGDLTYTTALADVLAVVNEDFDVFGTGATDNMSGLIDDLDGGTLLGGLGITPDVARLAYVEVMATDIGDVSYSLAPGSLPFALFGMDNVRFERVDLSTMLTVQAPTYSKQHCCVERVDHSTCREMAPIAQGSNWIVAGAPGN